MRTCPKCGFVQPPDKYCANCGVNMDTYRAKSPPLLKRILGSFLFQFIFITALLYSGLSAYLKYRAGDHPSAPTPSQVSAQKKVIPTQENTEKPNTPETAEETSSNAEVEASNNTNLEAQPESSTLAFQGEDNTAVETVQAEQQTAAQTSNLPTENSAITEPSEFRIRVHHMLLPNQSIEELLRVAEQQQANGGIDAGVVTNFESFSSLSQQLGALSVAPAETRSVSQDKEADFSSYSRKTSNPDESLGLRIRVISINQSPESLQIVSALTANFYDPEGEEPQKPGDISSYNPVFRLNPGSFGFIAGFLPHSPPRITETNELFSLGPFAVFRNEAFLQRELEYVIFFEADGLTANP